MRRLTIAPCYINRKTKSDQRGRVWTDEGLACGRIAGWSVGQGRGGCRGRLRGAAKDANSYEEKQRFGEPEGAVGKMGCGPCSENGSGEEAEGDEAEIEALGASFSAGFWGAGGVERVVDAFDCVAQIAGDEGGVEGEPVNAAETGDLECSDVGDDRGEGHVGEAGGHPAEGEESQDLEDQGDDGGSVIARAQVPGGGDAGEKAQDGDEMGNDLSPLVAEDGDREEDDVSGHGVGED